MTGHLHLLFAERNGQTFLREQSFRAPAHISKPYWDGTHLIVNVVNPTAGLFPGDTIEVSLRASANSKAVITSPSASRIFRAREQGTTVIWKQHLYVEQGAWMDFFPEMLIPHAGSTFAQDTTIQLENGASILYLDSMAPGRLASGEAFKFSRLSWRTELQIDGRLTALERYSLQPHDHSLHALELHFPNSYHASGFLVAPISDEKSLMREISSLSDGSAIVGASPVAPGAFSLRVLAANAITLRKTLLGLREIVYRILAIPAPKLRKL